MDEPTTLMNSIALATINAVRAEVAHVSDTGLPLDVFPAKACRIHSCCHAFCCFNCDWKYATHPT